MKAVSFALASAIILGSVSAALAQEIKVSERFSSLGLAFDLEGTYSNVTVTVTGPDDYQLRGESAKGAPSLDLREGGTLSDGTYNYQLSASTGDPVKIVREYLDNGRDREARPMVGASASGTFVVQNGSIVKFDTAAEPERR